MLLILLSRLQCVLSLAFTFRLPASNFELDVCFCWNQVLLERCNGVLIAIADLSRLGLS